MNNYDINKIEAMLEIPAKQITNGTKYFVNGEGGYISEPISAEDKISLKILINLNSATEEDLVSLPGIGIKTARNIVNYRNRNGHFTKISDLQNVHGIGPKKYSKIKYLITLD